MQRVRQQTAQRKLLIVTDTFNLAVNIIQECGKYAMAVPRTALHHNLTCIYKHLRSSFKWDTGGNKPQPYELYQFNKMEVTLEMFRTLKCKLLFYRL